MTESITTPCPFENRLKILLESGKMTDCEIIVDTKKERFRCHKLILGASSPFLEAYFYEASKSSETITAEFPDVNVQSFRILLNFIYSNEIDADPFPFHLVNNLLYASKKFQLVDFRKDFIDYLTKNIWPLDQILSIYDASRYYNEPRLIVLGKEHIMSNMEVLLNHDTLFNQSFSRFANVLEMFVGKCSDLQMFKAIEKYCIQNQLIVDSNLAYRNEENESQFNLEDKKTDGNISLSRNHIGIQDEDNNREKVEELCKLINFEDMTPQDFAEGPASSKVLDRNQSFEILVRICKKHNCNNHRYNIFTGDSISTLNNLNNNSRPIIKLKKHRK